MDSRRGPVASVILKDGILKRGEDIQAGDAQGKIKILENFLGESVDEIIPSSPAVILGFETLPQIGEIFFAREMQEVSGTSQEIKKPVAVKPGAPIQGQKIIKLILKGDTSGSLEVLSGIIGSLPQNETAIEIIDESVGDISDGDVKHAVSTGAMIIGFKVSLSKAGENLAKTHEIKIFQSDIIYELIKTLEEELKGLKKEIILGDLEILKVFSKKATKQVVGGQIVSGKIKNNAILEIKRKNEPIGEAKVINLQKEKRDVVEVIEGECGLLIDSETETKEGDHLIAR